MRHILWGLALLCVAPPIAAQEDSPFFEVALDAPHAIIDQPYFERLFSGDRKTLILLGKDEERRFFFSLYQQLSGQPQQLAIPENALFFDFLSTGEKERAFITYVTKSGISKVNVETGETQEIAPLKSVYRLDQNPNLSHLDFAKDLNGDGRDDILLQDFEGYHLLIQNEDGFDAPVFLPFPVEMRVGGQPFYDQEAPRYRSFPVYNLDMTLDGREDIAFLKDRSIHVFPQMEDGQFSLGEQIIDLPMDIVGNSMKELLEAEEASSNRANFTENRIFRMQDMDGDKRPDILTLQEKAEGTFDRKATYAIHFGRDVDGQLSFNADADTDLTIEGFSLFQDVEDVNGDGQFETITASNEIGIGKIVSALLTGSTKFDLNIHEFNADKIYNPKPSLKKKLRLDFEFSSGTVSVPAVKLADLNGDGLKELILDDEKEGLLIFTQSDEEGLSFSRSSVEYKVNLPKDGQLVQVEDIDDNGREDIIIHFDAFGSDGEDKQNHIVFLLAL